jgi:hypothetical protein
MKVYKINLNRFATDVSDPTMLILVINVKDAYQVKSS